MAGNIPSGSAPDRVNSSVWQIPLALISTKTSLIYAHNLDYDFFLNFKHQKYSNNPYAVFIDGDEAYQSDYAITNQKPYVNPKE